MTAVQLNKTTKDGLTIYDLDPQASELWAVAGPAGIDPSAIDPDNLPAGFRWMEDFEWEFYQDEQYDYCADEVCEYTYRTDAGLGVIVARDFLEAKIMLRSMISPSAQDDGAWGWVEDVDGCRYWIAEENSR